MLSKKLDPVLLFLSTDMAARTYIDDIGPGEVFLTSLLFFRRKGDNGSRSAQTIADMLECLKCMTLWLSMALVILRFVSRPLFLLIAIPLSVSRIASWGDRIHDATDGLALHLTRR